MILKKKIYALLCPIVDKYPEKCAAKFMKKLKKNPQESCVFIQGFLEKTNNIIQDIDTILSKKIDIMEYIMCHESTNNYETIFYTLPAKYSNMRLKKIIHQYCYKT